MVLVTPCNNSLSEGLMYLQFQADFSEMYDPVKLTGVTSVYILCESVQKCLARKYYLAENLFCPQLGSNSAGTLPGQGLASGEHGGEGGA